MDMAARLATLKKWFDLYDEFMAGVDLACGKGCAACCTCNVTSTTLEGLLIYEGLVAADGLNDLATKVMSAPDTRFQPTITLNQMVEMCVHDLKIPEEINDPEAGACPWLEDERCPLYAVRPFACRAMCSVKNCVSCGEARMPPLVLSVNNVMLQYIEALDRPGASGNLMDVLHFLTDPDHHKGYIEASPAQFPAPLKPNRSFSVLMIPPEHREPMAPLLQGIQAVLRPLR